MKSVLVASLFVLAVILVNGSVAASDVDTLVFHIKDLDNPWEERITVMMDALDRRLLTVQMDTQKICYHQFGALIGIRVLKRTFLELEFHYSGGGNVFGATIYKLLCVKNFKFYEALDAFSYCGGNLPLQYEECDSLNLEGGWDRWEYEYALHAVDSSFELEAIQYHKIKSDCAPELNVDSTDTLHLSFSREFGVFYNRIDTLSGCFYFPSLNDSATTSCINRIGVVAPGVNLGVFDETIIFVDGYWCSRGKAGTVYCGRGEGCPNAK